MSEGQIAQAAQASFKGANSNNFQERLDNNIKMAEEKLASLASSYTHLLSKEGQPLTKEDTTLSQI